MSSLVATGTALWHEVTTTGREDVAARVEREWAALTEEEQVAAVRAGTALWREVIAR